MEALYLAVTAPISLRGQQFAVGEGDLTVGRR
jgi:hypothetical protein